MAFKAIGDRKDVVCLCTFTQLEVTSEASDAQLFLSCSAQSKESSSKGGAIVFVLIQVLYYKIRFPIW